MKVVAGDYKGKVTKSEVGVLVKLACGYNRQDIADLLHLSLSTINTHVNHLLQKLDAHDKAHAVAKGLYDGIIKFDKTLVICLVLLNGFYAVLPDDVYAGDDMTPPSIPANDDFLRTRPARGTRLRVRSRLMSSSRGGRGID